MMKKGKMDMKNKFKMTTKKIKMTMKNKFKMLV